MNRKYIFAIVLLLAVFSVSTVLMLSDSNEEKNISDSDNSTVGYKYTVKNFNGNVAVFNFGSSYPIEVLECPLKSLPEDEAQRLTVGIDIETEEELQQLIEAYD